MTGAPLAVTVSGIVNTYAPVTAIAGNDVTIGATTGAATPFAIGDYALLIQMTGPPPAQAGSNMGNYELLTVTGVSGSTITLSGISNSYAEATEAVQLVRVPYDADGFTVSGAVNAKPWDGSTGGIVSLKGGTLTLNADIDASGTGFTSANPATTATSTSLSSGPGNPEGRGQDGDENPSPEGTTTGYAGLGGGGLTGGGVGNTFALEGGGMGGGGLNSDGISAPGTNGGSVLDPWGIFETGVGAGGGGGIIGGGGGGGGGFYRYESELNYYYGGGGGGGGIDGGGGGGAAVGAFAATELLMSASGGGPGGVGTGGNGFFGGPIRQFAGGGDEGSGGGGGGSYGGGGGAGGHLSGGDDGSGGGGGGSWAGGGPGGAAGDDNDGDSTISYDGGDGNTLAGLSPIPESAHYMNDNSPRLMLGGAGGGSGTESTISLLDGGAGGGIVLLEFDAVDGNNNAIRSDGDAGQTPPSFTPHSGSGGGGGGQMRLTIQQYTSATDVLAEGGVGGLGSADSYHGGSGGGGGGGGGIWFDGVQGVADSDNTGGQTVNIPNVNWSVTGGTGGQPITNPKNDGSTAGGGYGGTGFATVDELITSSTITLVKKTVGGDGIFDYFSDDPDFNLNIITSSNMGSSDIITKTAGVYTITEGSNIGWRLTAITVTGESTLNSTVDVNNRQAVVNLDGGEEITVTYTNEVISAPITPTVHSTLDGCILMAETNNDDNRTATSDSPIFTLDIVADACLTSHNFTTGVEPLTYSTSHVQDESNDPAYDDIDNTFICSLPWDTTDSHSTANLADNNHTWAFEMTFDGDATQANLDGFYLESGMGGEMDGSNNFIPHGLWEMQAHVWIDGVHDQAFTAPTVLASYDGLMVGSKEALPVAWRHEYFDFGSTYENVDLSNKTVVVEIYGWFEINPAAPNPPEQASTDIFLDDMVLYGTEDPVSGDCGCSTADQEGTITIVKKTNGTDGTFDFSSADPDLDAVQINTFGATGSSAVITKTAGTYTIAEDLLAGWTLANVTMSGDTDNGSSLTGSGAVIDLDGGEHITVTFHNEATTVCDADDLGGTVWRDYNSDGVQDAKELGFDGVTVTAYDNDGNAVATLVNPDGTYNFSDIFATETHIRLEFSGLPDWVESSVHGTNNGTTVQHHSGPSCGADLSVQNPAEYCQSNPDISVVCYLQPIDATDSGWLDEAAIVQIPYESGTTATDSTALNTLQDEAYMNVPATNGEVGSVFGLAYDRETDTMYTSAFMKRHAPYGPAGADAIYKITTSGVSTFLNLNTLIAGSPAGNDNHVPSGNNYQLDDIWDEVGKNSFGDLVLSDDNDTLYVVTLTDSDRQLYRINVPVDGTNPTAADIAAYPLPAPADCPAHPSTGSGELNYNLRPGALHFADGLLYVGLTCTAESTQNTDDLKGYVYPFDPNTNTFGSLLLAIPFDYPRTNVLAVSVTAPGNFYPWTTTQMTFSSSPALNGDASNASYPMPWLMNIGIADDGCMVLGIADRFGHLSSGADNPPLQINGNAGGDILKACNLSGTWTLESNSNDGIHTSTAGANTASGPGGGEFFHHDAMDLSNSHHTEISNGGFAILRGSGEVVLGVYDPSPVTGNLPNGGPNVMDSGGLIYLDTEDGSRNRSYMLFNRNDYPSFGFDKASATGGVMVQCNLAPLEIGNYVWLDDDGDGIQDPCEIPLPDVTVTLHKSDGTQIASAVTNSQGEYYFINMDDPRLSTTYSVTVPSYIGVAPTASGSKPPNPANGLLPNTDYEIRIDVTQSSVSTYTLTVANVDSSTTLSDSIDSDGIVSGTHAIIALTTGDAGENDHTFDFGFVPETADVLIGNRVWIEDDNDGNATTGVITPVVGSLVTAIATDGTIYTDTTDANGLYTITVPANATYTVTVDTPTGTLPAGTLITSDNDPNNDDNISHDGSGTVVTMGTEDNLTIDFGFYEPVLEVTHTPICPAGALLWVNNIDVTKLSGQYGAPEVDVALVGTVLMSYTLPIALPAAFSGPLDIDISEAVAWDGYLTRAETVDQPNERFAVLFMKDGNLEWQSPWTGVDSTDDGIATGITFDDWTGPLGTANLPNGADEIILIHWGEPTYGTNDTNYNSVIPCSICIEYSIPTADVLIGDRVWIENDNDGNAATGVITPVVGSLVTATATDGTVYTDITDANGYYTITVPANMTYTVSVPTPATTMPTPLLGGDMITDTVSGNDLSHDGSGTTVIVGTEDNLTVDFGFYELPPGTPSLAINKILNTPEPVNVGQSVTFTIRITNSGDVTITTLPLMDSYDTTYLSYDSVNGSTPATDDNAHDGQLDWSDLTLTEGDLAPGETIDVIVRFTAIADTTALAAQSPCINAGESCNVAAVNNATAGPDPVPPVEDSDDVTIEKPITGKSTLGDFVWYDTNSDGIKDPGELGINGVIINLYDSTGLITTTVTMSDTGGIGDDTGVTNGDGFYDFQVVESTVYTVEIDPSNFDPGGALEGYSYTGNNATMPYNGDETRVVLMPAVQHDENNVDFSYVAPQPQFELSKTLNTAPPVRVAERISFTIRITNTGTTVITTVPLTDLYSNAHLNYIDASPEPDNPTIGQLAWTDLTASGPTGFGMDLDPGETFEVVVRFLAKLDTTGLPNDSTMNLAESQGITDTAEVPIFAPTSVEFAIREIAYKGDAVQLSWETADETDIVGFHLYRQLAGNDEEKPVQITEELLVAKKSGSSSGAVYTFEDETAQAGVDYRYFVGILDTNGLEIQELLGNVLTQRTIDDWFIFLPFLMK